MSEDSIFLKSLLELRRSDPAFLIDVNYLESIKHIEVLMLDQPNLGIFEFYSMLNHIFEHLD